jgi:long-chain fatty acid transport protein
LIDVDLRYIDYANTSLFGTKVIDGGLGWRSVFAVALGAQYQATDRFTLRGGYLYNTNPIPNPATLFNVQAPGIITNTLTLGASYDLTENVTVSLAWMHGFRDSIEGPILQIPHSSVRLDAQVDTLWAGFNVKFGGSKRNVPSVPASSGILDSQPSATWSDPYAPTTPGSSGPEGAAPDDALTDPRSIPRPAAN